jgi:chitodextrinase
MSIIVAYSDNAKKVYPPSDRVKSSANAHIKTYSVQDFSNLESAKTFYLSKFWQYHHQIKRSLK